jgi:large repetitive protein
VQVWLQGDTEPETVISVTGRGTAPPKQGCSSTQPGSAGLLALLALLGLGARRRGRA